MAAEPVVRAGPILLVEDNPDDRELTLAALVPVAGAAVVVARDGVEALDYLFCRGPWLDRACTPPPLVLLDLKLPRVDGLQVLAAIRADARLRQTRVVVLTSSDEERDQLSCRRLGVEAYLRKAVDFGLFREQVRTAWPSWTGAEARDATGDPGRAPS
jgi:CheY-like chemotaxis protein